MRGHRVHDGAHTAIVEEQLLEAKSSERRGSKFITFDRDMFERPTAAERRHRERSAAQDLVHRLALPEAVIGGVLDDPAPEAHLVEPALSSQLAGAAGLHVGVVVVVVPREPARVVVVAARAFLLVDSLV